MLNRILQLLARFGPGATTVRPFIHKLRGVKLGNNVWIGEEVFLENNYPDHIEIGDETQLTMQVAILTHFRGPGRVVIGPRVWVGARALIAAAHNQTLTIGEGAVIGAGSVVTRDVPPFTFVAGSPAKLLAHVTVPMTLSTTYEEFKAGLERATR
jgi:acetyltransferase-like isoleucine patch superfamily enzyme